MQSTYEGKQCFQPPYSEYTAMVISKPIWWWMVSYGLHNQRIFVHPRFL